MDININIKAPGLENAIQSLAQAISSNRSVAIDSTGTPPSVEGSITAGTVVTQDTEASKQEKEVKQDTGAAPDVSLEMVRTKLTELGQAGKQAEVKELITSFGVKRLTDIPEDKFAEVLEKASEL